MPTRLVLVSLGLQTPRDHFWAVVRALGVGLSLADISGQSTGHHWQRDGDSGGVYSQQAALDHHPCPGP